MNPQPCKYIEHENGIHEFVFEKNDDEGADILIAGMERLFKRHSLNDIILVIIDFHKPKNPPILYTFRQAVQMYQRHPNHPYVRAAYLYNPGFVISTVKMYTSILRQDKKNQRQFYQHHRRDEAINWLLQQG